MTSVGAVSLSRFVPLKRHWYAGGTALDAVTLKDAVSPLVTMRLCGWLVMVGGNSRDNTAGGLVECRRGNRPLRVAEEVNVDRAAFRRAAHAQRQVIRERLVAA